MKVLAIPAPKERFRGTLQLFDLTGILLFFVAGDMPALLALDSGTLEISGVVPFQLDFTRDPAAEDGESMHIELRLEERSSLDGPFCFSPILAKERGRLATASDVSAATFSFFLALVLFFILSNLKSGGNLCAFMACSCLSEAFQERYEHVGRKH